MISSTRRWYWFTWGSLEFLKIIEYLFTKAVSPLLQQTVDFSSLLTVTKCVCVCFVEQKRTRICWTVNEWFVFYEIMIYLHVNTSIIISWTRWNWICSENVRLQFTHFVLIPVVLHRAVAVALVLMVVD